MPFNLPGYNTGAGAPPVEDGLGLARFDDLELRDHPDWAKESDKFGNPDDGRRFHFMFTLVDEAHAVVYHEDDPIEVEATTRTSTGEKSNFYALMTGLLTAKELAAWKAATPDDPFDGEVIKGRIYNVKFAHNEKSGWPYVEQVIGVAKAPSGAKAAAPAKKTKAELRAEAEALLAAAEAEDDD